MLGLKMKKIQVTLKNPESGKQLHLTAVRIKLTSDLYYFASKIGPDVFWSCIYYFTKYFLNVYV